MLYPLIIVICLAFIFLAIYEHIQNKRIDKYAEALGRIYDLEDEGYYD